MKSQLGMLQKGIHTPSVITVTHTQQKLSRTHLHEQGSFLVYLCQGPL